MEKIYTIDEIREKVKPVAEKYGIERVWLFGSYARGEATAESDVDILLDGFRGKSLFELAHLYNDISTVLNKEVDIINAEDLQRKPDDPLTKRLLRHIEKDRRVIYGQ